jgi:SAM-dependent methyltransferase
VTDAVELLRCPACHQQLRHEGEAFICTGCAAAYLIVNGIPRFVSTPTDATARRTQASFGYEWSQFNDWSISGETNFQQYFGDFDFQWVRGRTVLDAGCGMGRHARQMAPHAGQLIAMDFSHAIDHAARNTADQPNVLCIQGDITTPPVADGSFDLVYSLGVLHHIADTEGAARSLVSKVKPGGRLRIYLYWRRPGIAGTILLGVERVRFVTTRLPFAVLKAFCWILSCMLWFMVVLPHRALSAIGVRRHEQWPLGVYARYPFAVLYNDQFDRFSAPIEQRWTEDEVRSLMGRLGLRDVRVVPSFGWVAEGTKPK